MSDSNFNFQNDQGYNSRGNQNYEGFNQDPFTGAQKRKLGKLEFASGGTVFLDEIESMPLALQVKLLRVLQERRLERLGGNETSSSTVGSSPPPR